MAGYLILFHQQNEISWNLKKKPLFHYYYECVKYCKNLFYLANNVYFDHTLLSLKIRICAVSTEISLALVSIGYNGNAEFHR